MESICKHMCVLFKTGRTHAGRGSVDAERDGKSNSSFYLPHSHLAADFIQSDWRGVQISVIKEQVGVKQMED